MAWRMVSKWQSARPVASEQQLPSACEKRALASVDRMIGQAFENRHAWESNATRGTLKRAHKASERAMLIASDADGRAIGASI
jgi:hypothetical protein